MTLFNFTFAKYHNDYTSKFLKVFTTMLYEICIMKFDG